MAHDVQEHHKGRTDKEIDLSARKRADPVGGLGPLPSGLLGDPVRNTVPEHEFEVIRRIVAAAMSRYSPMVAADLIYLDLLVALEKRGEDVGQVVHEPEKLKADRVGHGKPLRLEHLTMALDIIPEREYVKGVEL